MVFESASGVNTDVVLRHTFTGNNDYVVQLNNADGISFKNMTITRTSGNYYGFIFNILNGSDCLVLDNNVIKGSSTNDYLIYSRASSVANNNNSHQYLNNTLSTAGYAIVKYGSGSSTTNSESGTIIESNIITCVNYIINRYDQDSPLIINNSLSSE